MLKKEFQTKFLQKFAKEEILPHPGDETAVVLIAKTEKDIARKQQSTIPHEHRYYRLTLYI